MTDVEELAREMKKSGAKLEQIMKETGLSKDAVKKATRDIWLKKEKERQAKRKEARKLFSEGIPRDEILSRLGISKTSYQSYVKDLRKPKKDFEPLRVEVRKLIRSFLVEIEKDPRKYTGMSLLRRVAEELGASRHFVMNHTQDIVASARAKFVSNKEGVWYDENGNLFVNKRYISIRLDISDSYTANVINGLGVSYVELWTDVKQNPFQKFYNYEELLQKSPYFKKRLEKVEALNVLPDDHILKYQGDMTEKQFLVFCTMLGWKNMRDSWPTNTQIAISLNGHNMSEADVKNFVARLQKSGHLSIEYEYEGDAKSHKKVTVHKGPPQLVSKKIECPHCENVFFAARDYVKPLKKR